MKIKWWLLLAMVLVVASGSAVLAAQAVKNPDTLIIADIGTVDSLDPVWAYDTASGARIMNLYETLIWYDGENTDKFIPVLATEVPTVENGGISDNGLTYTFQIKKGIKFHNGAELTPEDVEYSFERAMVQDRDGGPIWMLYEPLLGSHGSRDGEGNIVIDFKDIDDTIEVVGNDVVFHLKQPYPPFLAVWANTWGSIVSKEFCVENGDWPGTAETWKEYNNPEPGEEGLHGIACGSGPFKLERWEPGVETVLVRHNDYWREPAKLKRAIWKVIDEWTTRKLMIMAGDADIVYVPRQYMLELEEIKGIRVTKNLPTIDLAAAFFNLDINPEGNTDIGSGKLDGKGIPSDFFSDKDVRSGFAYSFDWDTYLKDVFFNEAEQPVGPIPTGLAYRNPKQKVFHFDPEKAKEYFQKAWGGKVWEKGFQFNMLYNTGNAQREVAAFMFKENVESLNPKFRIEVRSVEWASYLRELIQRRLTLFLIGWVADFADAHNFVHPFMHSQGDFSCFQSYNNPLVDELIWRAINTTESKERERMYHQLQIIYHDDCPSVPLHQMLRRHYERDWVKGWYYNPILPNGDIAGYLYSISKGW